jgi:hypothetical protein
MRMYDIALAALDEILPDLNVAEATADSETAARTRKPVTTKQVHELVARLLDETDTRGGMIRCLRAERARSLDALRGDSSAMPASSSSSNAPGGGDWSPWSEPLPLPWPGSSFERVLSRPVFLGRAQQGLERLNLAIRSFEAPDLCAFLQAFPENPPPRLDGNGEPLDEDGDNGYTRLLTSTVQQAARMHYVAIARRRTTATALALSLFRATHAGNLPAADLKGIVPAYLPTGMPGDPLSTSGEKLVYVADPMRPRVYSVGEDGIDDGGWPAEPFASRPEDLRLTDWVVDLNRQPRHPPPTTPRRAPVY